MTKDINAPDLINLNIERHHVIDSVNSDIGKDHPSVRGANGQKRISKRSSRLLLSPPKNKNTKGWLLNINSNIESLITQEYKNAEKNY